MRKIVIIGITLMALLGLAACGKKDRGNEDIEDMTPSRIVYLKWDGEEPEIPEGEVSMRADELDIALTMTLIITNNTDETFVYGRDRVLEKLEDGEYKAVWCDRVVARTDDSLYLEPGEEVTVKVDLAEFCDKDSFEEGTYRLLKSGLVADFELGVEWTE